MLTVRKFDLMTYCLTPFSAVEMFASKEKELNLSFMWSCLVDWASRLHCLIYSTVSFLSRCSCAVWTLEYQQWHSQFIQTVATIDISQMLANSKLGLSCLAIFQRCTTICRQDGNQQNITKWPSDTKFKFASAIPSVLPLPPSCSLIKLYWVSRIYPNYFLFMFSHNKVLCNVLCLYGSYCDRNPISKYRVIQGVS